MRALSLPLRLRSGSVHCLIRRAGGVEPLRRIHGAAHIPPRQGEVLRLWLLSLLLLLLSLLWLLLVLVSLSLLLVAVVAVVVVVVFVVVVVVAVVVGVVVVCCCWRSPPPVLSCHKATNVSGVRLMMPFELPMLYDSSPPRLQKLLSLKFPRRSALTVFALGARFLFYSPKVPTIHNDALAVLHMDDRAAAVPRTSSSPGPSPCAALAARLGAARRDSAPRPDAAAASA